MIYKNNTIKLMKIWTCSQSFTATLHRERKITGIKSKLNYHCMNTSNGPSQMYNKNAIMFVNNLITLLAGEIRSFGIYRMLFFIQ